jgi:hypothetical protein
MDFNEFTLKETAAAIHKELGNKCIPLKSSSARKLFSFAVAGHERFESLVEQARNNGTISLTPDPRMMLEWGKTHRKNITLETAEEILFKAITAQTTLPISFEELDDESIPVYCPNNVGNAHPAYICLDQNGFVFTDYGEVSSPYIVFGRTLRWPINANLNGREIKKLFAESAFLLERIHAGHSIEWDGKNNAGSLSDDASEAADELSELCKYHEPDEEVYLARELIFSDLDISEVWTEDFKSFDEFVTNCEGIANNHRVYDNVKQAILKEVDDYLSSDEHLPQHIIDALL